MYQIEELAIKVMVEKIVSPLPLEEISKRAARRRLRRRVRFFSTLSAVIVLFTAAYMKLSPTSNSIINEQFTSFSTPGKPHLLDNEIHLNYLPSGFHLVSDSRHNKTTYPAHYRRTIVYQGGTGVKPMQVTITVIQSQAKQSLPKSSVSNSSEKTSTITVRNRRGIVAEFFDHVSGIVHTTIVDGRMEQSISCSGPVNAPLANIDPICRSAMKQKQIPLPSALHSDGTSYLSGIYPMYSLNWISRNGDTFQLNGEGENLNTLVTIANNISYNSSIGNCVVGGRPLVTGDCRSGIISSPLANSSLIPAGGVELASGSIRGKQWVLSADMQSGNSWVNLAYAGHNSDGGSFGSSSARPTVALESADNGERFTYGLVPSSVTKVEAVVSGDRTLSANILPAKLGGWSFFVLPLGKAEGICNDTCNSPVKISLFSHSKTLYSATWRTDGAFSGVPIRR